MGALLCQFLCGLGGCPVLIWTAWLNWGVRSMQLATYVHLLCMGLGWQVGRQVSNISHCCNQRLR